MIIVIVSLFAIVSFAVGAQDDPIDPDASPVLPETTAYTPEQLDQMLAPIALYPDPLVAQILMAATYPSEVVDAARWLQDPDNAALRGDQVAAALQAMSWDPSLKALIVFPDIVRMMDGNLQWTEQLGDAFIGQQAGVMDEIQRLRRQAIAAGTLQSSPSQTVTMQDGIVVIEPANPDVVNVPIYNPMNVYGTWPYPDYPPDYFTPDYVFGGSAIDYGVGVFIVRDLSIFHHLDFRHHRIDIDDHRFRFLNGGRPSIRSGIWTFDPAHRHEVPHHAPELRRSVGSGQVTVPASQRPFRGFGVGREGNAPQVPPAVASPAPQQILHSTPGTRSRSQDAPLQMHERSRSFDNVIRQPVPQSQIQRPSAPVFESHTHGVEARTQSVRGQSSRSEMDSQKETGSFGGDNRTGGDGRGHR